MNSRLEEIRSTLEEIEFYQTLVVEELLNKPSKQKYRILQERYVSYLLDKIVDSAVCVERLEKNDEDQGKKNEEISLLCGNDLTELYTKIRSIQYHHKNNPNQSPDLQIKRGLVESHKRSMVESIENEFSGEEFYGKFLDLNLFHERFLNLKGNPQQLDYLRYLREFDNFNNIPKEHKLNIEYFNYMVDLTNYLENFIQKSKPLFNFPLLKRDLMDKFEELSHSNTLDGLTAEKSQNSDELFCQSCLRQFSTPSTYKSHLTGKNHLRSLNPTTVKLTENLHSTVKKFPKKQHKNREKDVLIREFLVVKYAQMLETVRDATASNVERKMAQTFKERQQEAEEIVGDETGETAEDLITQHEHSASIDEEIQSKIYNPLKLPLDWDGKPIPYWLWKLHGLGVEYPCEICGGFVYMGRRAFDRHFQEWRHNYGMKCLGISNGRQFYGITSINDALSLWDCSRTRERVESFRPETMEEYEDEQGNVFSRKTFEDLRKQGLI